MSWTVAAVMTRDVATVSPGATYKAVAELLHERRVSALPVLDARGRVVGVVSEADLLLKEERPAPGRGALGDPHGDLARATARSAGELMTSPAVTIRPEATLTGAARLMRRRGVKRLPVVDEAGLLVGLVSRADLIRPFLRSDESIAREVREEVAAGMLAIDPAELAVTVEDGVVRLEGELETCSLGRILARLAGAVEGVVAVDNRLRWKLDDSGLRPDTSPLALRFAASERE
jgi:CBS domain-containing protein